MDIGTIDNKLRDQQYANADEFHNDVKLIFKNCYRYNGVDSPVSGLAKQLEKVFDKKWLEKPEEPPEKPSSKRGQSSSPAQEPESSSDEDEIGRIQEQMTAMAKRLSEMQSRKKQRHEKSPTVKGKGSKSKKSQSRPSISGSSKPKKSKEFVPEVTFEQKRELSEKINFLSPSKMQGVLELIKDAMPLDAVCSLMKLTHDRHRTRLNSISMFSRGRRCMLCTCTSCRTRNSPRQVRLRIAPRRPPNRKRSGKCSLPRTRTEKSQRLRGCWIIMIKVMPFRVWLIGR
jgi:Bromodomain/Bromodomain extra-terminal - transcription regulation